MYSLTPRCDDERILNNNARFSNVNECILLL